jgi:hypothetical protein
LHATLHTPLFSANVEEELDSWNQNATGIQTNVETHPRKDAKFMTDAILHT